MIAEARTFLDGSVRFPADRLAWPIREEQLAIFRREQLLSAPGSWRVPSGGSPVQVRLAHVSGALNEPFVVLFEEYGADEPNDGSFVGEDTDDAGEPIPIPT